MPPLDRKTAAAAELSTLKHSFRYRDHQRFEAGAYGEIVQRFQRQARFQFWLGVASGLIFGVMGGVNLVQYGASAHTADLLFGVVALAWALGSQVYWVRSSARVEAVVERVTDHLDADEMPAAS